MDYVSVQGRTELLNRRAPANRHTHCVLQIRLGVLARHETVCRAVRSPRSSAAFLRPYRRTMPINPRLTIHPSEDKPVIPLTPNRLDRRGAHSRFASQQIVQLPNP
jgi:hypothetical protein